MLEHMNPCADGLIGALEPKPTGVEHTTTIWRQRSRVTPRGGETEDTRNRQTLQTALIGPS